MPEEFDKFNREELIKDFINESSDQLHILENDLVELASTRSAASVLSTSEDFYENEEIYTGLLNEMFRAVHTIKGLSTMLELITIKEFCHKLENLYDRLRTQTIKLQEEVIRVLFLSSDVLKGLIVEISTNEKGQVDYISCIKQIDSLLVYEKEGRREIAMTQQVRCPGLLGKAKENLATIKTSTIRIAIEKLDILMNLMGELVIRRNQLEDTFNSIINKYGSATDLVLLSDVTEQFTSIINELQKNIIRSRMLPIKNLFARFKRPIYDIAKSKNKEIDLICYGGDTELDREVIEAIYSPLLHLLRNSIDHGIESEEEREKSGKQKKGIIKLIAYQQGQHVFIEVEDDGKGIDYNRIREIAVEKGIITEHDNISEKELLNFIFLPGFSTAKEIDEISGRGVGMDVVRNNIISLNGNIEIKSIYKHGTKFIIQLPLTLAIIPSLLVRVCSETFAIPLSVVSENIRILPDEIYNIRNSRVIRLRDILVQLVTLDGLFKNMDSDLFLKGRCPYFCVVLGIGERKIGLIVDELIGEQNIVIKSLGEYLGKVRGISGATILGNGEIVLILDINSLLEITDTNKSSSLRKKEPEYIYGN